MATECVIQKQDSNFTGLSIAEEVCLGVLPSTGAGDPSDPVWYEQEPNSYSDFGGELITTARSPIKADRQNSKGTVTDLNANGGFNADVTLRNTPRYMQGFCFADAHEKPSTAPLNGTNIAVTSVTGATHKFNVGSSAAAFNKAGYLVQSRGFGSSANNVVGVVASADADDITLAAGLADEAGPPATATVEVIGFEFGTADVAIVKTGNNLAMTSTANVLNTLGLTIGEWIYIGGDAAANGDSFANNKGFARISTIAAGTVNFDLTTFAGASEVSTGKKIRIFFGKFIRNESNPANIKRRSYQMQRTLGNGDTATQAEYLIGCVSNEFKRNVPLPGANAKITADFGFVATDFDVRSGEVGDVIKSSEAGNTTVAAVGEDAFNTANDIYLQRLYVLDPSTANPTPLFGYVSEASLTISNSVTPNKAVGVLGAFDVSIGNFVVTGSLNCYFTTVAATRAIRQNADCGYFMIAAKQNVGFIDDICLLSLGGGRNQIEKDNPIKVPLTPNGSKGKFGYTYLYNFFPYLPNAAMPQ